MTTLSTLFLLLGLLPPLLYTLLSPFARTTPTLSNKRILLLIAHPDDEAMFFAPSILSLTRNNHVKILCLSTGDADGLGETRRRELVKSALHLGLKSEDDVVVVDDQVDFRDSMSVTWEEGKVAGRLEREGMDVLVTFDEGGVSGHPNHISLYHGARAFIRGLLRESTDGKCPVDLYTLTSINIVRKYAGMSDALTTMVNWFMSTKSEDTAHPESLIFMSHLVGGNGATWGTAWKAMTEAHVSQMRWFRYGWICLSRYMVVNDLQLEKVKAF